MTTKNFSDPEKMVRNHARIKGFLDVDEFEAMFAEFEKEKKKHKKGSAKHKEFSRWQDLDGTKKGLKKVMGKK